MKPSPELLAAYKATTYNVHFEDHTLAIRIGEIPLELNDLMIHNEVGTWAIITSFNPLSEKLPGKDNEKRNEKLAAAVEAAGLQHYPGESVSDAGDWPVEKNFLILGLNLEEASNLARDHEQHAIIFGRFNKAAQLIWCNEND